MKTCTALLPLIVSRFVPGPVSVVDLAMAGKPDTSVIVPVAEKTIFPPELPLAL